MATAHALRGGEFPELVRRSVEPPRWRFGALRIRRYRSADHAEVVGLHRSGLAQVGLRPGDGIYYEDDLERMEELYLCAGGEFLVGALPGGALVAMGGLRRYEPRVSGDEVVAAVADSAEMVRLRVRADLQRRGYGLALALALEQRAVELGYRRLCGDTTEYQGAAIQMYRLLGWREIRRVVIGGIVNIYGEKDLFPQ